MSEISIYNYDFKKWDQIPFSISKLIPVFWTGYFDFSDEQLSKIENRVAEETFTKNIFPYPELVMNCFNYTLPENLKVVILGQDPYIKRIDQIPQAMGLSFSIPTGMKPFPPSLINIYENLNKFKHLMFKPSNGNLQFWANQGCLLLNTSLTVEENKPGSHTGIWKVFTNQIIESLSNKFDNLIFVLWGTHAYEKINLIDLDKHKVIISSHPSPLSVNGPMMSYPAFKELDHFGKINKMLFDTSQQQIIWQLT